MIRFINFITTLLLSFFVAVASAQDEIEKITISGQVQSAQTVTSDTVIYLIYASDKSLVKTEYADEKGFFAFADIPIGNYLIIVTQDGVQAYSGSSFEANATIDVGLLQLNQTAKTLDEVVVVKAKPYIERHDGKLTLNVENSIAATGSSAFEVLEKAPGINVDSNDNISLRGKTGIIVQIDGKPTPMSGTNLANYLRGIPAGSVEKIEFITNPSSKYDAAGTSIINIKMKKDKRKGSNGSVSVAYGQGKYPKSNNNLSMNHRDKKVNVFGNYSFAYREGFNELLLNRKFYESGVFTGAYEQDNYLKMNFRNHIGRAGTDYFINDKHTLGIVASAVSNRFNPTGQNYSDVYDETNTVASRFESKNRSKDNWHNYSVNANYKYVIDTTGTEFTTDFDFANYGNKTNQNFDTDYFNPDGSLARPKYLLFGYIAGDLNIYAIKSDYVSIFSNKVKLETGLKSSYVKADNNLVFFNGSSGTNVFDPSKSNHFIYTENINAAYANASREFGKWNFQIGLRMENTNITGKQLIDNTTFDKNYTQLFPSAFASYSINTNNSVEFNYSRRIQRPSYDQLNPFKFYLDPTTYKEGNPFLEPQTTHSVELTHVLNQKIYSTLSFTRTDKNITETISPSPADPKVTIQTNQNLNSVDIYGLYVIAPIELTKWWDVTNSVNLYVGSYSGMIANTTLSNDGNFTWNANAVNNFKLGNGFFAELTGNYRAEEQYAFMLLKPVWFVSTGLQKKFKNKSTLKLAISDIFKTNHIRATIFFTGYKETFDVTRDAQVATLSYTYNFGNSTASSRRRTGGAEDIKQRAGSSNG